MEKKERFMAFGGGNILLLGITSFLNDFSSDLILPILPLLIASFGGTGLMIGLIGGLMEGLPNLLKVFSGYFSDKKHNRKKFIFWGYFLAEISKFMLIFTNSWAGILTWMGLNKCGKGIREAPRDALISESLPSEKGKGFGIQRAFDVSGALLGSLTLLIIVFFFGLHFQPLIIAAAVIGFTSLIPLYLIKNIDLQNNKEGKNKKIFLFSSIKHLSKQLKFFIWISVIFALGNFSYMFFILKSMALFSADKTNFTIPIMLYVLFNIFYALFAIPIGKLSDKMGRRRIIAAGYFLFSIVSLGFLFFSSIYVLMGLFVLYGISYALIVGSQRAFVSDLSEEEHRATALGALQTAIGISAIVSGVLAGILFDINPDFTFIYGFVLALLSGFLLILMRYCFGKPNYDYENKKAKNARKSS